MAILFVRLDTCWLRKRGKSGKNVTPHTNLWRRPHFRSDIFSSESVLHEFSYKFVALSMSQNDELVLQSSKKQHSRTNRLTNTES